MKTEGHLNPCFIKLDLYYFLHAVKSDDMKKLIFMKCLSISTVES